MARSAAKLRAVDMTEREAQPEDLLPNLFEREDQLLLELRRVRETIRLERDRFRARHGLLMLPGHDVMKRQFGRGAGHP